MRYPNCLIELKPDKDGWYRCNECFFQTKSSEGYKELKELYVFAAVHPDGSEGIIGLNTLSGQSLPAVCNTLETYNHTCKIVERVSRAGKITVKAYKFTNPELLKTFKP